MPAQLSPANYFDLCPCSHFKAHTTQIQSEAKSTASNYGQLSSLYKEVARDLESDMQNCSSEGPMA